MEGLSHPTSSLHHRIPKPPGTAEDFCSPPHWPARPTKGWLPNQKKGGGVRPVSFFYFLSLSFFFLFFKMKRPTREKK